VLIDEENKPEQAIEQLQECLVKFPTKIEAYLKLW
jgi:hypothetical protein